MAHPNMFDRRVDLSQSYYSDQIKEMFGLTEEDLRPAAQPERGTNVPYNPNESEYSLRSDLRQLLKHEDTQLPESFPQQLPGPLIWEPNDFLDEDKYTYHLKPSDIAEISAALEGFKATARPLDEVKKSTFPLPGLRTVLAEIRDEVYTKKGFAVIRGLMDMSHLDPKDRAVIFLGLSSYIGEERGAQDRYGTMLKHLMDDERDESLRDLPFHTDVTCDVSAIMTNRCSDHGGRWTVASASAVYNDLAKQRPDLIRVLAEPDWPFDTFGRYPPFYRRAVLYFVDGKIIFNFSRRLLAGHPKFGRSPGVPGLTKVQAEALDAVHFTALRHHLMVAMQEGDIRFINNMSLLHGREGFYDDDGDESRRHVMRLWLRNRDLSWTLPPALQLAWARIFDDRERPQKWIVESIAKDEVRDGRGPREECD